MLGDQKIFLEKYVTCIEVFIYYKFHKRMNQWSWWLHLTSVTHIGVLPEGSLLIREATEDQYLIYQTRSYHTFTQSCDYEYRLQTKSIPVSLYKIIGQLFQPNFISVATQWPSVLYTLWREPHAVNSTSTGARFKTNSIHRAPVKTLSNFTAKKPFNVVRTACFYKQEGC